MVTATRPSEARRYQIAKDYMKRVLLIAPYFVPRRRVGAMRPFRFAMHLREFGWTPIVLTLASPGQRPTERESQVLDGIEILEITSPLDRTTKSESNLSSQTGAGKKARTSFFSKSLEAVDRQLPVDGWLPLMALRYRQIEKMVRKVGPDVIWATGDPWSSLVLAGRLSKTLNLPFVADFRDPWTLCRVRTARRAQPTRWVDGKFERRVLEKATVVLFQARGTEALYKKKYASLDLRTETITNSFSAELMSAGRPEVQPNPPLDPTLLNLCFFGRFREYSPASVVAEALALAVQKDESLARSIRIHSSGSLNAEDLDFVRGRGVEEAFVRQDSVPLEAAVDLLRNFDVLLLSTDVRRPEIIPAKLFEYIAARRPIISLSRNPEVAAILDQTGTGAQFDPHDAEHVADLLLSCASAKRDGKPMPIPFQPDDDSINRYEARSTTAELAELFDSLLPD